MPDDYIPDGYIILARKIRKSPLWQSLKSSHRMVLIEILLQAQFKDMEVARNGEIIFLKRGQLATSYQQLVDDIGDKDITIKVVRNAIEKLLKYDFLSKDEEKARSKKGLLLTVKNYDIYQNPDNYKSQERSEIESKIEASSNRSESKIDFSDKDMGKVENSQNPYTSTDLEDSFNEQGKEKGITRAKQGQSEGKARAINNNVNNANNVNNDSFKESIYSVFHHWNEQQIIVHKELNQKRKSAINARLENKYSVDSILKAIDNYAVILKSEEYFWTYKWTLEDFMNPKNLDRFLEQNNPKQNFRKDKGGVSNAAFGGNSPSYRTTDSREPKEIFVQNPTGWKRPERNV